MKYLNLTPHPVRIYDELGHLVLNLEPAQNVRTPRVMQVNDKVDQWENLPIYRPSYGKVANLPDHTEGVVLIVSRMVRQAVPASRTDVVCPGVAIRDASGTIIGARGLSF